MHTTWETYVNAAIFTQRLHHHAHVTGASGATPSVVEASKAVLVHITHWSKMQAAHYRTAPVQQHTHVTGASGATPGVAEASEAT